MDRTKRHLAILRKSVRPPLACRGARSTRLPEPGGKGRAQLEIGQTRHPGDIPVGAESTPRLAV